MLYLLRKLQQSGQQLIEQQDLELRADAIAVGSGEDQLLQLFGAGIADNPPCRRIGLEEI